jgi:phosphatidylserine/phosphatidylglycerophosphate/cardiolipin synthase-like enzyme
MKKLVHPLVALVVLALGMVIMPSAQAKATYTPSAGVTFNDPTGKSASPTALMDQIIAAVNNVPKGSIIRIVAYSFDYEPMRLALTAAKDRGVQVRLLIDSHTETTQIKKLRSKLGTGTSDGSYLRTCKYSCMANKPSFIHSKLYLFSRTGSATRVAMNSSANPAETGVSKSWNNTYTTVGDKTIYDANVDTFNDMLPDKTNTDYYHTVESSGSYPTKEYFFPRAGSTKKSDTLYNILNDVSCPSTIKVSTYFWTSARLYLADKLVALRKAGCTIEVVYPDGSGKQDTIYPEVTSALLKGKVDTWNTRPNNGLYVHNKVILINGTYQGVAGQKIVYATSQNFTKNSLRNSNEVMLRIPIPWVYDAYSRNFDTIKQNSVPLGSKAAAKTTAGVDSASETRSAKAPKDNSPDPDE